MPTDSNSTQTSAASNPCQRRETELECHQYTASDIPVFEII